MCTNMDLLDFIALKFGKLVDNKGKFPKLIEIAE